MTLTEWGEFVKDAKTENAKFPRKVKLLYSRVLDKPGTDLHNLY